jgi:bifunctional aspartokinase / homoserine dehydrogenase 1
MSYRIVKFGGSNLQNATDFSRCAEIIRSYEKPCVVVVSAFFKVTDHLKQAALQASDNGDFPVIFMEEFSAACFGQIISNISDVGLIEETNREVQALLDKLFLLFKGIHAIGELPPTINDSILSYGERISAVILAAALRSKNINAAVSLPENFGLVTDGEFGGATILLKESATKVRSHFRKDGY